MAGLGRIDEEAANIDAVVPYSMHVSSKYLELTRKKLELTRLPREVALAEGRAWALGTPKSVLETVLDYWLEHYDWRAQEAHFNTALPQFRTTISLPSVTSSPSASALQSLRIHFVHKRSKHTDAVPLLFCHSWPSSFLEAEKIISALANPEEIIGYGAGARMAFHVVVPSIPGFGFSDAAKSESFGVEDTARAFDAVMMRLGYDRYVVHGTGWGFNICRAIAQNHSEHCAAIHTANPSFDKPSFSLNPVAFLKYQVARLTRAKILPLSFGYVPSELQDPVEAACKDTSAVQNLPRCVGQTDSATTLLYSHRPQTLAFSLCDSPVGLLAGLLDVIHTRASPQSPIASRSRSPFLSPSELDLQESEHANPMHNHELGPAARRPELPPSRRQAVTNASHYMWTSTEILNWTMLQWLPGPEGGLRWLRQAHLESSPNSRLSTSYCSVPLGISSFRARNSDGRSPIMWGSASNQIAWVKRHNQPASVPAWEAADMLVLDMRDCFGSLL